MHQVISTELSNVWWFLWFIWCFIKTNDTPPWIHTDPKALAVDCRPLPSSVTRTKGLWDCWPSILAWAPVVGCCHGDEAVWCSLQQTPAIAAPVDHNNTPWPAFLAPVLPSFEHQNSALFFPPLPPSLTPLTASSSFLPPALFSAFLSRLARWASTRIASGVYLYVENITEMSQHWWCWVLDISRCLYHPYSGQQSVRSHLCSAHIRCDNFLLQNTNEFVPSVNLPVNL